jgi:signal transduction histidine kinase
MSTSAAEEPAPARQAESPATAPAAREARLRAPLVGRLPISRWFAIAALVLALATAAGITLGVIAIARLAHARALVVNRLDPATTAALRLSNALVNEETGVRGYALTGQLQFLAPYRSGRRDERRAVAQLRRLLPPKEAAQVPADTAAVRRAISRWQQGYAQPEIARIARRHGRGLSSGADRAGMRRFDAVRSALTRQQADLAHVRADARARLAGAATFLSSTFVAIAVLLALSLVGVVVALRYTVTRPLRRVGRQVRRTARGDYQQEIVGDGPRDVVELAQDVEAMRRRILDELGALRSIHDQLDEQAGELQRSNAELEQFAYVASHDLQEPLRKVASFCQLIEQRYDDQLDERGRQYIAFAVDGARRMQQLINDLLTFSRVGRAPVPSDVIACDDVLRNALTSLAAAIEESGAEIAAGPLPPVRGEPALLAAVFQNLIGNALKFRGPERPRVEIAAARDGDAWLFTIADNGIGIEPQYAERIFMIFQRLHPKDVYAGTGIGLALSRKIVEYHGGRIWLDTDAGAGTTFRFTLPAIQEADTV